MKSKPRKLSDLSVRELRESLRATVASFGAESQSARILRRALDLKLLRSLKGDNHEK